MINPEVRVLLIGDDEDESVLVRSLLLEIPSSRYSVERVSSCDAALSEMSLGRHDVCLFDYRLGEKRALELAKKMNEEGCSAPIIILTGHEEQEIGIQAMNAGVADYLIKERLSSDLLERSIRYAIKRKQMEVEIRSYQHGLEDLVEERTAELAAANLSLRKEIEDREKAEKALRQSEKRYKELADLLPQTIYEIDPEGHLFFANHGACSMFGYGQDELQGGMNLLEMLIAKDHERALANIGRRLTGERLGGIEYTALRKDGSTFPVMIYSNRIKSEDGTIGLRGIIVDITDHKRAEEKLDRERRQLLSIFDSIDDPVYVSDPETYELLYANRALKKRWGDGVGGKCYEVLQGCDSPCSFCTNSIIFGEKAGQPHTWEYQNLKIGRWFRCMAKAIHWPEGRLVRCEIASDTTERKLAEEALRESEERFRIALDNIPDVFVIYSSNLEYQFVNKRTVEITGYSEEAFLGRRNEEIFPPEVAGTFLPILNRAAETRSVQRAECSIPLGGSTHEMVVVYVPLLNAKGEIRQVLGFTHEITERKQLEAQLRQTQKLQAIGTLAGGIAHDFNNILAAIIGYSEMALDDLPNSHPVHAQIEEVFKAANRAKDLVKQILAFSRMSGREERVPVDIGSILREASKFMRATLPSTIEIHQEITCETCMALAAPAQIFQVIVNLCTNAAHAMEEHGGVIEISLVDVNLDTFAASRYHGLKPGPYLSLAVRDTGTGMDRAILDRIFDPYFTTKPIGKGSGLGLAVVQGLVKRHEGAISVYSEKGKGSVFHVFLPGIEKDPEKSIAMESSKRGNETILFVDDEEVLVRVYQKTLEKFGYQVKALMSGIEALEIFRREPDRFDLVITDYTMPHMTGEDLAREILTIRPDIPIILTTGFNEKISEERALEIGAREYIVKPISGCDLAGLVREVLDKSR